MLVSATTTTTKAVAKVSQSSRGSTIGATYAHLKATTKCSMLTRPPFPLLSLIQTSTKLPSTSISSSTTATAEKIRRSSSIATDAAPDPKLTRTTTEPLPPSLLTQNQSTMTAAMQVHVHRPTASLMAPRPLLLQRPTTCPPTSVPSSTAASLQPPSGASIITCHTTSTNYQMCNRRRPIPNSYWATPWLVACEYPWAPNCGSRPKLDALLAAGVRTFIDLTEKDELVGYAQLLPLRASSCGLPPSEASHITYHRFPIPDRTCPANPHLIHRILSLLAFCEQTKTVAAVHCRGGIGRTGTVVGCWLVQSGRVRDGEEALGMVGRLWEGVEKRVRYPMSPETGAQAEYVRNFKKIGGIGEVDLERDWVDPEDECD